MGLDLWLKNKKVNKNIYILKWYKTYFLFVFSRKEGFETILKYYLLLILNIQKGKNILFLNQRDAAKKAREILLKKQKKINEELKMINSLIMF